MLRRWRVRCMVVVCEEEIQENCFFHSSSLVKECRGRDIDLVLAKYLTYQPFLYQPALASSQPRNYLPLRKLPKMNAAGTKCSGMQTMTQRCFGCYQQTR